MESILSGQSGGRQDESRDFESVYNTKAFRILQVMIPFFPASIRPMLAVGLRFSQFQYALSLSKKRLLSSASAADCDSDSPNPDLLLEKLKSCLSPSESKDLERMQNMLSMMQRIRELEPFLSQFGGFSEDASMSDIMDMVSRFQGTDSVFCSEDSFSTQPDEKNQNESEEERKGETHEQGLDER